MVESFDFSLGIIVGIVITFMGNYITGKLKENEQRKTLARALITELEVIKDALKTIRLNDSKDMPIFSTNIPTLVLLKKETIDAVLRTYQRINHAFDSVFTPDDITQIVQQIDETVKIINKEL